jgi:hypothetical protein
VGEAVFYNFEEARLSQPASDLAILLYTSTERSLRYSVANSWVYLSIGSWASSCKIVSKISV